MSKPANAGTAGGSPSSAHDDLIRDQFSRQAEGFAHAAELHDVAQLALIVEAARPQPDDVALDIACGPGTVVAAFAPLVQRAVGLDATEAMLDQARALARRQNLANVEWRTGDAYRLPFAAGAFDIVTCRFAFHHFEAPQRAFAEMTRVCRRGGRVALCDAVAPADPAKAAAFNAMERHRDPSTAAFRPLAALRDLFTGVGLPAPAVVRFQVAYERERLIEKSFPANDDRATLRRMLDTLIADDAMGTGTVAGGTKFIYPAVVLAATKP